MATSTQHFNLIKPSITDNVNVGNLNTNFENIDTIMYDNQQKSEGALGDLADAFSTAGTYAVGDLVIYENKLYKCTTAVTLAEAWDSTKWTATTLAAEMESGGNADLYFLPGDNYQYHDSVSEEGFIEFGYVTSSTKKIKFDFTLPKFLKNVQSATCTALWLNVRGRDGSYVLNSAYVYGGVNVLLDYDVDVQILSQNRVHIIMTKKSGTISATNNTSVQIDIPQIQIDFA